MTVISRLAAALLATAPSAGAERSNPLPAFDHVAINVADQQRSVDFYRGVFGLKEIPAPFPAGGPRWMALSGGISLHIQSLPEKPSPPPRAVHFAISVADLKPLIRYLEGQGIVWTDAQGRPRQVQARRTDQIAQIYFQDPDGYWIEANDKLKRK